jgi:cobalt-zinc-cadmium efflux system outer membrane protein
VAEPLVYHPVTFPTLSDLIGQAERQRPELKSAIANLASLRAAPGLQRSAYYPNVVLATDFAGDGLYVGLSIPIDLGGIRGAVAKADADIKTQRAQVEVQRQSVDMDVKSSYVAFEAAQKQVDTYNSGILSMSATLVDEVRHGYELGANTIVDIITAENTYRSVESSYFAAVGSYVQAAFGLKHSVGELPQTFPFAEVAGPAVASASGRPVSTPQPPPLAPRSPR